MVLDRKNMKYFFHVDFLDVMFFLSIGFMVSPFSTKDNLIPVVMCIFTIGAYLLAFFLKNFIFYCRRIYANKKFDFLAFLFALNFLFLLIVFMLKNIGTTHLDLSRLFYFHEPSVILFYAWGVVTIFGIFLKDRYRMTAE